MYNLDITQVVLRWCLKLFVKITIYFNNYISSWSLHHFEFVTEYIKIPDAYFAAKRRIWFQNICRAENEMVLNINGYYI